MTQLSDAQLVTLCRKGDENAWRELVERFSRYVYAICISFRLGEQDAEDVFQDVFARAYQRRAERNRRARVTTNGFRDDVLLWQLRQLLSNLRCLDFIRDN